MDFDVISFWNLPDKAGTRCMDFHLNAIARILCEELYKAPLTVFRKVRPSYLWGIVSFWTWQWTKQSSSGNRRKEGYFRVPCWVLTYATTEEVCMTMWARQRHPHCRTVEELGSLLAAKPKPFSRRSIVSVRRAIVWGLRWIESIRDWSRVRRIHTSLLRMGN